MEFLCLLAFLAAWGFMWRWVVKNRGNWNLFVGNVLGAGAGFIVGIVVFSITLSLFAPESKTAKKQIQETVIQEVAPVAAEPEPVPTPAPVAVAPPAPAPAPENFPSFVAGKPQNEPSPPESALLPNFSKRLPASLAEKDFKDTVGNDFAVLRRLAGSNPNADKSLMAFMICEPFIKSAMRFSASTVISSARDASSQRFKDQTYTVSSTATARNMLGDDISYRFDCSVQQVDGNDAGKAAWRLLDLKLKKSDS
ncbi:hypothetical protein JFT86_12360 [Pseudomonas sp. TH06]|uniref:hypothetical protein n=1 Tax=Pseudomonas sp. TH06 TaxID=2796372 RepID=UPI001911F3EE|nr:hypothetical protein [Pseudomonas sp. TH06]MBK5527737.1 hypothetical protein [Pseudomonas sp. TH06]